MSSLLPARGDVFFIKLPDSSESRGHVQSGPRPGVIVQIADLPTSTVIVILTTTSRTEVERKRPTCVFISAADSGIRKDSVVLCHQVATIDRKLHLLDYVTTLPPHYMKQIDAVLREILGLP